MTTITLADASRSSAVSALVDLIAVLDFPLTFGETSAARRAAEGALNKLASAMPEGQARNRVARMSTGIALGHAISGDADLLSKALADVATMPLA